MADKDNPDEEATMREVVLSDYLPSLAPQPEPAPAPGAPPETARSVSRDISSLVVDLAKAKKEKLPF